jgi:hypothetical protein
MQGKEPLDLPHLPPSRMVVLGSYRSCRGKISTAAVPSLNGGTYLSLDKLGDLSKGESAKVLEDETGSIHGLSYSGLSDITSATRSTQHNHKIHSQPGSFLYGGFWSSRRQEVGYRLSSLVQSRFVDEQVQVSRGWVRSIELKFRTR